VDEREVLLAWRNLFHGKEINPDAIAKAETLLDGLSGESPLHLRLANELKDLQKLPKVQKVPKARAAK
jgi:hypothetical protein